MTLIPHWLSGYSQLDWVQLASAIVICTVSLLRLFYGPEQKRFSLSVALVGVLVGTCIGASALLRGKPHWDGLSAILELLGGFSGIVFGVLIGRNAKERRRSPLHSQPAPASDDTAMDLCALLSCPSSDVSARGVHSGGYARLPTEKNAPSNRRLFSDGPRRSGVPAPIGAAATWC